MNKTITINAEDVQNIKDAIELIKEWAMQNTDKHFPLSPLTLQSIIDKYENQDEDLLANHPDNFKLYIKHINPDFISHNQCDLCDPDQFDKCKPLESVHDCGNFVCCGK